MAYIKKEHVLEHIKEFYEQIPLHIYSRNIVAAFKAYIKNLPDADAVEVKHGEWNLHPDGSGTCNQCGRTQKAVWDFDNAQEYCGKCGAKMDGGKAE